MKMPFDEPIMFDKVCKKETRQDFIQVIKDFIRFHERHYFGFDLEISSNYKSFRKIKTHEKGNET